MARKNLDIVIHNKNAPFKRREISLYFKKILECLPEAKKLSWSISVVSNRDIEILNKNHKGKKGPTDVLAFFYPNADFQAEIIISSDMAVKNAADYGNSLLEEFLTYLIHGVLHILGYNDIKESQKSLMLKKQKQLLKQIL
jgi:probable rRNA maturation factor